MNSRSGPLAEGETRYVRRPLIIVAPKDGQTLAESRPVRSIFVWLQLLVVGAKVVALYLLVIGGYGYATRTEKAALEYLPHEAGRRS